MSDERWTIREQLRDGSGGHGDRYPIFLLLLILDVVLLLIIPNDNTGLLISAPFVAGTLLLGLYTSDARPRTLRIAAVAGAITVAASVIPLFTGGHVATGLVWLMIAGLVFATPWTILRHIFSERRVTLRTIFAAVSVYILIGLVFAFVDLAVQAISGTFFAQSGVHGPADFVYFSYICMCTVGFGDLTPAAGLPRALTVPEAIIGQVFLVTTVARLVSMYGTAGVGPVGELLGQPSSDETGE